MPASGASFFNGRFCSVEFRHWGRRVLGSALLAGAFIAQASSGPAEKSADAAAPVRVLIIGNSYQYYNNSLHNHLRWMVEAADPALGKRLQYKSATIGGAALDHHNVDWLTTPGRIGVKEPFELVVLQGGSNEPLLPARRAKFRETVIAFDQVIRSRGGRTALYMTHAYSPSHPEFKPDNSRLTSDMYSAVGKEVGAKVIPVGLAFEESYRRHPEIVLHNADGTHPSLIGTYLAACTAYAAIYGRSPVGNPYNYHGAIDSKAAALMQKVAQDVVQAYQR